MHELLLLRHAKSSWDDPSLEDFDRPLAVRGNKDAQLVGSAIAARGWVPDAALVSHARRARQTWRLIADAFGKEAPRAVYDEALYTASAGDLLAVIGRVPESVERLAVVGHNPAIGDLAAALAGSGSDAAALAVMRTKFPTAALARFEVDAPWSGLVPASARLTHFLRPKDLEN